ncbi:hypothetical protein [Psychroserpens sp.]|uniref:hypothetical protein n=1 Tax=Psychroserpens sp. TaxID=2020870 RepID=UPI00385E40EA
MAPIKFEEKLKDKLENRTLQPSSDAWNTLADRLDAADKKNNNVRFWWIGIAASLLGVILVTTQFYKKSSTIEIIPTVVDTESKIQKEATSPSESISIDEAVRIIKEKKQNIEIIDPTELVSLEKQKASTVQEPVKRENTIQSEKSQDVVANLEINKASEDTNDTIKVLTQEELKVIQVVDVIKQLQTNESSVSEREIDSLLKQAQREILKQNIYNETTKTVDANALLQDVEVELEQSFRDKVFEALKSGYGSVKTAVAERRN